MRFIPHIRTRRWIWLAVALVVTAAWVGSMRYEILVVRNGDPYHLEDGATLSRGTLLVCWDTSWTPQPFALATYEHPWGVDWLPTWQWQGPKYLDLPLWPLVALMSAATMLSFRKARRLARIGSACPHCSYPRAGLPAAAPCPECGKA